MPLPQASTHRHADVSPGERMDASPVERCSRAAYLGAFISTDPRAFVTDWRVVWKKRVSAGWDDRATSFYDALR